MDIYLLRHGIAAPLGVANNFRDERRELTEEGIQKMRATARGLQRLKIEFDLIASSPLVRAQQTAAIVVEATKLREPVAIWEELMPEGAVDGILNRLAGLSGYQSVLLAGHQPSIGWLAGYLLSGKVPGSFPFKKGAVLAARIGEVSPGTAGELLWMLPSKMLRQIGEL